MAKKRKKSLDKITTEEQYKMWRRARRELDPPLPPATVHKTDKKDKKDKKRANTIKEWGDDYGT